jgi:hypothetical protein
MIEEIVRFPDLIVRGKPIGREEEVWDISGTHFCANPGVCNSGIFLAQGYGFYIFLEKRNN